MIWFKNRKPEEQIHEIERAFKSVFSSEDGKIVLAVMLEEMAFFRATKDEEDVTLKNYAVRLLEKIGIKDHYDITLALLSTMKR